ncbi:MAG: hypothetical protein LUQ69_09585 [Methanoregulaceae archaeon]|nr:hypothetical protein [Methanoregulaceae archaeon]
MILAAKHTLKHHPTAPFNFDATLHKPDHFPSADNAWEPGVRWQTMRWQGKLLGLKIENSGTIDQPAIRIRAWAEEALPKSYVTSLRDEITFRYNLDLDLSDFYHRFESHPRLRPVIERWRGMRPVNLNSLYEYLIISIVLQNATVRRTVQMMQNLLEAYGTRLVYDGKELYGFWEPQALANVSEEELRTLKVGYRAKSIQRVTEAFLQGEINEMGLREKSRDEQRQALLGLYGIGPASVGYLLTDVFHHWDELNHIPPWEQKIYSKVFFDVDPETPVPVEQLMDFFNTHFTGYRALAVHYFWEDLWWQRKNQPVEWLEKLIRL